MCSRCNLSEALVMCLVLRTGGKFTVGSAGGGS